MSLYRIGLIVILLNASISLLASNDKNSCGKGLSALTNISLSYMGKYVAFESYGSAENEGIYYTELKDALVKNIEQKTIKLIVNKGHNLKWSNEGDYFLYDIAPVNGESDSVGSKLYIGSLSDKEHRFLTNGWLGSWSPDSKKIAYVNSSLLNIIDVQSGKIKTLFNGNSLVDNDIQDPSWSPDGSIIVFSRGDGRLWSITSEGKDCHPLTEKASGYADMQPEFAPDGKAVVFTRGYYGNTRSIEGNKLMLHHQIFIKDLLKNKVIAIAQPQGKEVSDTSPQWMPDGKSILFIRDTCLTQEKVILK